MIASALKRAAVQQDETERRTVAWVQA